MPPVTATCGKGNGGRRAPLCNRNVRRSTGHSRSYRRVELEAGALPKFSRFTQPASQPYQPGSCLQRPHRGTGLVFVIVLSQPRHDPLTPPRNRRRPSRACFCGRLPLATLLPSLDVAFAPLPAHLPPIITTAINPHDDGPAQATGAADRPKHTILVGRLSRPQGSNTPG